MGEAEVKSVQSIDEPKTNSTQPTSADIDTANEHTRRMVTEWQSHEDFGSGLDDIPPDAPADVSSLPGLDQRTESDSLTISGDSINSNDQDEDRHGIVPDDIDMATSVETSSYDHTSATTGTSAPRLDSLFKDVTHEPEECDLTPFQVMLTVWEKQNHITREGHAQLMEVFKLATSLDEIHKIPSARDTLNSRLNKCLPLRTLHKIPMKLDATHLPSRTKLVEDMYVFDLEDLVRALLSSESILSEMYFGMAHYTDGPIMNPWESRWWGESIRSTSGNYFHYPDGNPVYPSDFVRFQCPESGCVLDVRDNIKCGHQHMGRVTYCGLDYTVAARRQTTGSIGEPVILLQPVYRRDELPAEIKKLIQDSDVLHRPKNPSRLRPEENKVFLLPRATQHVTELLMVEDRKIRIQPRYLINRISGVTIDYQYKAGQPSRHPPECTHYLRFVYNERLQDIREARLTNPHRAELELKTYGRDYFEHNFVQGTPVLSLPFQIFIDAFGLYRTMYRSLLGVYLIGEFFSERLRLRKKSIFPLTLGPFAAEKADVIKALYHIRELDHGKKLMVNGKQTFVCAFTQCIVGDMPQQQELSGCLNHQAKLPCRFCMIPTAEKDNLYYDIVRNGRYHEKHCVDLQVVRSQPNITAKKKCSTELGVSHDENFMQQVQDTFPALDLLKTRPGDAAHSEGQGLSRILHNFIFKDGQSLLTRKAADEICRVYQTFAFPPAWQRLQSPRKHLDSWTIAEYLRGAIVLPVILRCWLDDKHIRPEYRTLIKSSALKYLDSTDYTVPIMNFRASDWTIVACRTFAQSVIAIFNKGQPRMDREQLTNTIINGRKAIQFFCEIFSLESEQKATTRGSNIGSSVCHTQDSSSVASTMDTTPISTEPSGHPPIPDTNITMNSQKRRRADFKSQGNQFANWKGLPNIHIGIHLPDLIDEFGSLTLVSTLPGEGKHKEYKVEITKTNHRDASSTMIRRENTKLTLYLMFSGSFASTTPTLHDIFQLARKRCPRLVRAATAFDEGLEPDDNNTFDDDLGIELMPNVKACTSHEKPSIRKVVPRREVKLSTDPLTNIEIVQHVHEEFLSMLKKAFIRDYEQHLDILGNKSLTWAEKFAFTSSTSKKRFFFRLGSYIKVQEGIGLKFQFARLDGIFTYHRISGKWLFLVVTFLEAKTTFPQEDYVLKHPFYQLTNHRAIVGLPRISPEYVWMVQDREGSLLFIDHSIWYM
ncbi:hypothetical protein GGS21DRAFT_488295 [Xylaria nigripes]|nr:hypothetical protein GGS21DRAFT_488295 [Xylaria nigripes]